MINKITRLLFLAGLGLACSGGLSAQQAVLDAYVQEGLANNPGLQQSRLQRQAEETQVAIAERMHYPTVAMQGTYTVAAGGRSISLPIGDLLNPVYGALNQLTQSEQFPMIENVKELFAPHNFLDLKVRSSAPIINPDIKLGRQASQERLNLQTLEVSRQEKELTFQIKQAYFKYLQASEAVRIYENARELVRENYRTNEVLLRNDKINEAPLLRARAELAGIESDLLGAQRQQKNAASFFNTLLARPLESAITLAELPAPDSAWLSLSGLSVDASQRLEVKQIDQAFRLNELSKAQAENYTKPRLNTFVDLGAQARLDAISSDAPYMLAGVQLEWNLWNGGRNKLQTQLAEIQGQQLMARRTEANQQLALQQQVSLEDARAAFAAMQAVKEEVLAAETYFRLINRSYELDVSNYIELVNARTQLTQARLKLSLRQYELWQQLAAIERAFN